MKPSYLLTADSDKMTLWRSAASSRGSSFADFARGALDVATSDPSPAGRFIDKGLLAIGPKCYGGHHNLCSVGGCECSCHSTPV